MGYHLISSKPWRERKALFIPKSRAGPGPVVCSSLMPGTAKRIAKRAKIRYKGEGDLLDPTINASLGGALMRELSRKFKGDPAAMLAGYNASQKASSTWRSRYLEKDIDQMIENIIGERNSKVRKARPRDLGYLPLALWARSDCTQTMAGWRKADLEWRTISCVGVDGRWRL